MSQAPSWPTPRLSRAAAPAAQVLRELGLCIALYDVLSVGEPRLHHGSPAQHVSVEFRLVMFRPFVGEILVGTIIASTADAGARAGGERQKRDRRRPCSGPLSFPSHGRGPLWYSCSSAGYRVGMVDWGVWVKL